MNNQALVVIGIVILSLVSCRGGDGNVQLSDHSELIAYLNCPKEPLGSFSSMDPVAEVIESRSDFESWMTSVFGNVDHFNEIPVDYSKERLVFVTSGKNVGISGHYYQLNSISETNESIEISYDFIQPEGVCSGDAGTYYPYCIIVVKNTSKEIKLHETAVSRCKSGNPRNRS